MTMQEGLHIVHVGCRLLHCIALHMNRRSTTTQAARVAPAVDVCNVGQDYT